MTIEKLKNMAVKWEYVNIKPNQREYNQPVFAAYLKDEILVFNQDPNKQGVMVFDLDAKFKYFNQVKHPQNLQHQCLIAESSIYSVEVE